MNIVLAYLYFFSPVLLLITVLIIFYANMYKFNLYGLIFVFCTIIVSALLTVTEVFFIVRIWFPWSGADMLADIFLSVVNFFIFFMLTRRLNSFLEKKIYNEYHLRNSSGKVALCSFLITVCIALMTFFWSAAALLSD